MKDATHINIIQLKEVPNKSIETDKTFFHFLINLRVFVLAKSIALSARVRLRFHTHTHTHKFALHTMPSLHMYVPTVAEGCCMIYASPLSMKIKR